MELFRVNPEYTFLQPEYVESFKCDGQKCNADCCKRWKIRVEEELLNKYYQIESAENEITSNIEFSTKSNDYSVALKNDGTCPFLNDENLCKLQLKYGENFLSQTCKMYPRIINKIDNVPVFERSLTLSCPVAADLILLSALPIKFKLVKEPQCDDKKLLYTTYKPPRSISNYAQQIRMTSIKILQKRDLSIDQRLAVLGVFLDILDETIKAGKFEDISQILDMYSSDEIIYESLQAVWRDTKFDYKKFITIMLSGIMEILYGNEEQRILAGKEMFEALKDFLKIDVDGIEENAMDEVAKKLDAMEPLNQKFTDHFAIILENYLVNEFFINRYPWSLPTSIPNNFGVFVATYKIIELMTFAESVATNTMKQKTILDAIVYFSRHIDHNARCIKRISEEIGQERNIPELVSTFLRTNKI